MLKDLLRAVGEGHVPQLQLFRRLRDGDGVFGRGDLHLVIEEMPDLVDIEAVLLKLGEGAREAGDAVANLVAGVVHRDKRTIRDGLHDHGFVEKIEQICPVDEGVEHELHQKLIDGDAARALLCLLLHLLCRLVEFAVKRALDVVQADFLGVVGQVKHAADIIALALVGFCALADFEPEPDGFLGKDEDADKGHGHEHKAQRILREQIAAHHRDADEVTDKAAGGVQHPVDPRRCLAHRPDKIVVEGGIVIAGEIHLRRLFIELHPDGAVDLLFSHRQKAGVDYVAPPVLRPGHHHEDRADEKRHLPEGAMVDDGVNDPADHVDMLDKNDHAVARDAGQRAPGIKRRFAEGDLQQKKVVADDLRQAVALLWKLSVLFHAPSPSRR